MAVVTYQCTVCKRQNNLVQFQEGLDWIGHCNITLGCRGTLYQVEVHPDYVRAQLPADVVGLQNWVQRKVLFNFTQSIARTTWTINHDLGTAPAVEVYINAPTTSNPNNQVQILPEDINYITDDTLTLTFTQAYSGIAQCIARSSNPDILNPRPQPPVVTTTPTIQLSNQGILTIATRIATVGTPTNVTLTLQYALGSNSNATDITYTASSSPSDLSPWADTSVVIIKGKTYTVRTFNIQSTATVTGQVANNSSAQLVGFNSAGAITLPIITAELSPINAFVVAGNYSLYFTNNSVFETINTGDNANNVPWVASGSVFNPETNQTTISVSNDVTGSWGSSAAISDAGIRQIVPGEVLILLGSKPFTIFDKITTSYVDFTSVDNAANQDDLFFNAGDLYAQAAIQQTIYPPISPVS